MFYDGMEAGFHDPFQNLTSSVSKWTLNLKNHGATYEQKQIRFNDVRAVSAEGSDIIEKFQISKSRWHQLSL